MSYELLLLASTFAYLCQIFIFVYAVSRARDHRSNATRAFVSVIIAARNEEGNVSQCLDSVLEQTYPADCFEVILANDGSTDETGTISRAYASRSPNVIAFDVEDDPILRGKTNALAQAIERSKGEIILITDADCIVRNTWIEETVKRYAPDVGIVGGMTLQRSEDGFSGMQSLDWAYLLGIAAAGVSLRNPLSTIGNNLSFRRSAYDDVGGYRRIPFSVTEDYTLFQSIVRTGRWEYLYPLDPALIVTSRPCRSFRELYLQKKRWGKGGKEMKPTGLLIMTIGFLQHTLILGSLFFGSASFLFAAIAALCLKSGGDYVFLHRVLRILHRESDLRYFLSFQLYYFFYVLILPFTVFFGGRVRWKGRMY